METPSRHSFDLNGSLRVFPIPSPIKGDNYCRLEVDGVIVNDRTKYDIVNNSVVFLNVADVPDGSQLDVLVVQSEEAIGQLAITTNIDIVASNIADINTVATDIAKVTTVHTNIVKVNTVADSIANVDLTAGSIGNVNIVGNNTTNVNKVAAIDANVTTVATNDANVTKVANIDANVTKVANIDANVTKVANIDTNVTTVADNDANVTIVAGVSPKVTTVADNVVKVVAVADNATNINAVFANASNITAVAGNESNINAVFGNATNINSAVANAPNINAVVANAPNIDAVAGNETNINAVVTNAPNINAVFANESNITAVANNETNINDAVANETNINAVVTNAPNINTVADNIGDVNTVVTNLAAIQDAPQQASDAAASAVSAAQSSASAAAVLDNFDDRYLGAKTSDPALDNDGDPLVVGALYFNTPDGVMKIYTATGWLSSSSASVATLFTFEFVATAGQTVFTGLDANGTTLSYTAPAVIVTLNGIRLRPGDDYTANDGVNITLTTGATVSDELVVDAFGNFLIADTVSRSLGGTFQSPVNVIGNVGATSFSGDGANLTNLPNQLTSGTAVLATSGTAIDFTGIPSWAKRITILGAASTTGASNYVVRIGNTTITTSGYASVANYVNPGANSCTGTSDATGFILTKDINAGTFFTFTGTITLQSPGFYVWSFTGNNGVNGAGFFGSGYLILGSALDRVSLTTLGGTDTFDGGTINIMYE